MWWRESVVAFTSQTMMNCIPAWKNTVTSVQESEQQAGTPSE
jgi:hypothetical protein